MNYEYKTTVVEPSWQSIPPTEHDKFAPVKDGWRLVAVSNNVMYWEREIPE